MYSTYNIDNYLGLKNFPCKKRLFGKLVIVHRNEIVVKLPYSDDFISNYIVVIINCHLY